MPSLTGIPFVSSLPSWRDRGYHFIRSPRGRATVVAGLMFVGSELISGLVLWTNRTVALPRPFELLAGAIVLAAVAACIALAAKRPLRALTGAIILCVGAIGASLFRTHVAPQLKELLRTVVHGEAFAVFIIAAVLASCAAVVLYVVLEVRRADSVMGDSSPPA